MGLGARNFDVKVFNLNKAKESLRGGGRTWEWKREYENRKNPTRTFRGGAR